MVGCVEWRNPLAPCLEVGGYIGYGEIVPSDKPLLNFIVEPALLQRLDDYRFKHRFPTRAAAIKWLLEWALKQNPKPEA